MTTLSEKASTLKRSLPPERSGKAPAMKGILLGTLAHKEGEIRIVWDEYEGRHFLSIRLWTSGDDGSFWPSKTGFTVKVRDLPSLGDAISQALDLALKETPQAHHASTATHGGYTEGNAPF